MPYTRRLTVQDREIEQIIHTQTGNVAGAGGAEDAVLVAPSGHIYVIKNLYASIAAPIGATSGTHTFALRYDTTPASSIIGCTTDDAKSISIDTGITGGVDSQSPSDNALFQKQIYSNLVIDETLGVNFRYVNSTDAAQTGDRVYVLVVEKTRVI